MKQRESTIVVVLNIKGGVGKTHTSWLLAANCQERGLECLLVDVDPQANLTSTFLQPCSQIRGSEQLFNPTIEPEIETLIRNTELSCVDLIPTSFAITEFNLNRKKDWESLDLQFALTDPLNSIRSKYDLIVIDCPAETYLTSYAALCAADFVLTPVEPARWGALGAPMIRSLVSDVRTHHNDRLRILGFVLSKFFPREPLHQEMRIEFRRQLGSLAFFTPIARSATYERAVALQTSPLILSPHSYATKNARQFFDEFIHKIEVAKISSTSSPVRTCRRQQLAATQ